MQFVIISFSSLDELGNCVSHWLMDTGMNCVSHRLMDMGTNGVSHWLMDTGMVEQTNKTRG